MSDYLANLAARTFSPTSAIRPLLASRFASAGANRSALRSRFEPDDQAVFQREDDEAVPDISPQLEENSESVAAPAIREIRKGRTRRELATTPAQRARLTERKLNTSETASDDDLETKEAQFSDPLREFDPRFVSGKPVPSTPAPRPRVRVQDPEDDKGFLFRPHQRTEEEHVENALHDLVLPPKPVARSVTTLQGRVQHAAQDPAPLPNPALPPTPEAPVQAIAPSLTTPHAKSRQARPSTDHSSFESLRPRPLEAVEHADRKADAGLTIRPRVTPYRQSTTSPVPERMPALVADSPSAVHVTIGRIEVRAIPPSTVTPRARPAPTAMGLDEYLRRRNGGGGP